MNHSWIWWKKVDIAIELDQCRDEGKDLSSVMALANELQKEETPIDARFQAQANELMDLTAKLPVEPKLLASEPSDLAAIQARRPSSPTLSPLAKDEAILKDKLHGAWLGRCAGCLLGKPIECWKTDQFWPILQGNGHTTITDYLWKLITKEDLWSTHAPWNLKRSAWENYDKTDCMPGDDDTNYTMTGFLVIQRKGIDYTPADMATFWLEEIPALSTCTAERVAYRNFMDAIDPPMSATIRNPYREWIGAQIRADAFGYIAMGRPALAAELAWRDASISHIRNGIYGEMWVAAMIAAAACESDIEKILLAGLAQIPAQSRLSQAIHDVMDWHRQGKSYEEAVKAIHQQWNEKNAHHWCHTISNAQVVALGLLYGQGDYEASITRAVYPCFDTDCNGATVGSIIGMVLGAKALPTKWTSVMNDTICTSIRGYARNTISGTAAQMFEQFAKYRSQGV